MCSLSSSRDGWIYKYDVPKDITRNNGEEDGSITIIHFTDKWYCGVRHFCNISTDTIMQGIN